MCSVVGYVGKGYGRESVIEGLTRLEYRGYDSAGLACLNPADGRLVYVKASGRLNNLLAKIEQSPFNGHVSVGHTRWATHGVTSADNAHPHFDCEKSIAIVHNGVIENHHGLRIELENAGHIFHSQTDTEIIAHLFEAIVQTHASLKSAVIELVNRLEGAYAFVAVMQEYPDGMLLVRKRSPLCIGVGDGEMFVASDLLAFAGKTKRVLYMPDESFAFVKKNTIELFSFAGKALPIVIQDIDVTWIEEEKAGHEHFMLKEIYEQKQAIQATLELLTSLDRPTQSVSHSSVASLWDHVGISSEQARSLTKINLLGCGTSWHAARIAQFFFEEIAKIPTRVHLASEFRYMSFFPEPKTLFIAISQSGETADTLEALRMVSAQGLPTMAVTNVASSAMVREADGYLLTQAGYEVAVASTKAFSTQMAALYWFANRLALERGVITKNQMELAQEDVLVAAEVLENSIEEYKVAIVQSLAKRYSKMKKCIFLGRHVSYPFAMEAALKLKEISYIFAQSYPAGELKHGPLALVDADTPIFLFSHQDPLIYQKLLINAQEVKARGGHLVVFAFAGQDELCELANVAFIIPKIKPLLGPLSMTGLMQFFVYQIAKELGCAIDKPRNLAKSVTVE
jgi:glucosamine--fructose-6-phosphate aminotransferase (isomerizing)